MLSGLEEARGTGGGTVACATHVQASAGWDRGGSRVTVSCETIRRKERRDTSSEQPVNTSSWACVEKTCTSKCG